MSTITFENGEVYVDKESGDMLFADPLHKGIVCYLSCFHMEVVFMHEEKRYPKDKDWVKYVPYEAPLKKPVKKRKNKPRKKTTRKV
jgi:hypothetical protein